jgi:hypothetical protein
MEKKERYNGWTNYETWLTALHMDNCEGSQEYFLEACEQFCEDSEDENESAYNFSLYIEEMHEEQLSEALQTGYVNSVFYDLLNNSLKNVNWFEIAQHILEAYKEETE